MAAGLVAGGLCLRLEFWRRGWVAAGLTVLNRLRFGSGIGGFRLVSELLAVDRIVAEK